MDMQTVLWMVVAVIGAGALVYVQRLRHQRLLRQAELAHQERLAAIEKGLELPPLNGSAAEAERATDSNALKAGLILLLGGIGIFVAFTMVPAVDDSGHGLHSFASLGLIPAFAGSGLLLFSWMARASSR